MSKIGIIGAMELEVATLKKNMDTDQITKKAGMEFHEGNLKGMPVVVVQCSWKEESSSLHEWRSHLFLF